MIVRTQLRRLIAHVLLVCGDLHHQVKLSICWDQGSAWNVLIQGLGDVFPELQDFNSCQHAVMRHAQSSAGCLPLVDRSLHN